MLFVTVATVNIAGLYV